MLEGIDYQSSMNANQPAVALNDRAEHAGSFPDHPELNRAPGDELLDVFSFGAHRLGFGSL